MNDKLSHLSKEKDSPKHKSLLFASHPDDFELYFETLKKDIFSFEDATIYYLKNKEETLSEEELDDIFEEVDFVVFPLTQKFLEEPSLARDEIFPYALIKEVSVLPIIVDSQLSRNFKKVQKTLPEEYRSVIYLNRCLDKFQYSKRLNQYLSSLFLTKEEETEIEKTLPSFSVHYLPEEKKKASELVSLIHQREGMEGYSVLQNEEDKESIAFHVLALSSGLISSYQKEDIERLIETKKPVLAIEIEALSERDKEKFASLSSLPILDPLDKESLDSSLSPFFEKEREPKEEYLLGLSYLKGITVEKKRAFGASNVEKAADRDYVPALKRMVELYQTGDGVYPDKAKATMWQNRLIDHYQKKWEEESKEKQTDGYSGLGSEETTLALLSSLSELIDMLALEENSWKEEDDDLFRMQSICGYYLKTSIAISEKSVHVLLRRAKIASKERDFENERKLLEEALQIADSDILKGTKGTDDLLFEVYGALCLFSYDELDFQKTIEYSKKRIELQQKKAEDTLTIENILILADLYSQHARYLLLVEEDDEAHQYTEVAEKIKGEISKIYQKGHQRLSAPLQYLPSSLRNDLVGGILSEDKKEPVLRDEEKEKIPAADETLNIDQHKDDIIDETKVASEENIKVKGEKEEDKLQKPAQYIELKKETVLPKPTKPIAVPQEEKKETLSKPDKTIEPVTAAAENEEEKPVIKEKEQKNSIEEESQEKENILTDSLFSEEEQLEQQEKKEGESLDSEIDSLEDALAETKDKEKQEKLLDLYTKKNDAEEKDNNVIGQYETLKKKHQLLLDMDRIEEANNLGSLLNDLQEKVEEITDYYPTVQEEVTNLFYNGEEGTLFTMLNKKKEEVKFSFRWSFVDDYDNPYVAASKLLENGTVSEEILVFNVFVDDNGQYYLSMESDSSFAERTKKLYDAEVLAIKGYQYSFSTSEKDGKTEFLFQAEEDPDALLSFEKMDSIAYQGKRYLSPYVDEGKYAFRTYFEVLDSTDGKRLCKMVADIKLWRELSDSLAQ